MLSALFRISPILLFANHAFSWGDMGHRAVGYLSLQYMTPAAVQLFNHIIQPNDSFDISDAAVWADRHKIGTYAYTYNWHFIDARDHPPEQCDVKYSRDCDVRDKCDTHKEPGCVVGAIVNQTAQIIANPDPKQKQTAMKFLLHLVGDIHQPLHVEDLERGGNEICVKWKGRTTNNPEYYESHASDDHSDRFHSGQRTSRFNPLKEDGPCPHHRRCRNLHQIWDSSMIEELLDWDPPSRHDDPEEQMEKARALRWANDLFGDSEGNPDLAPRDCVPVGTTTGARACAMKWASESNNLICSFVLKDGQGAVEGHELSGDYYEGAVPIIKAQITRAARRFAAMLNAIATVSGDEGDGQQVLQDL